jgi:polysaccharide export outer membrane protein
MHLPHSRFSTTAPAREFLLLPLLLWLAAICSGCQHGRAYRASELPQRLQAQRIRSASSLNLSKLADQSESVEVIRPGDVLNVSLATGLEEGEPASWLQRVSPDGHVTVPLVGAVAVGGMRLTEAERAIREAAVQRDVYRHPNVAVAFERRESNRIIVAGAVEDPGVKELPVAASGLVDALVAAGGLAEDASSVVELRRPSASRLTARLAEGAGGVIPAGHEMDAAGGAAPVQVDLEQLETQDGTLPPLEDGTVLTVVRRPPPTVSVVGLVQKPGRYDIPYDTDMRLLDALALGGGRTLEIADKVSIVRTVPGSTEPALITASVKRAKGDGRENIRLAPGDVISVDETPTTFTINLIRDFVGLGFTSPLPGL